MMGVADVGIRNAGRTALIGWIVVLVFVLLSIVGSLFKFSEVVALVRLLQVVCVDGQGLIMEMKTCS